MILQYLEKLIDSITVYGKNIEVLNIYEYISSHNVLWGRGCPNFD
jgi:hypothetical protein